MFKQTNKQINKQTMKKSTVVHSPPEIPEGMCRLDAVRPQPKLGGNGCCCRCCGAAPGDVDPAKILADGGRFVQLGNDGEENRGVLCLWEHGA